MRNITCTLYNGLYVDQFSLIQQYLLSQYKVSILFLSNITNL